MALAGPVPPWLNIGPETFTGAMAAGGRLGVTALAQDVKSQIAADRLQQAYASLAEKERQASEALQGKLQLGEQQLKYKQDAMDLRNQFQQQGLEERITHNKAMEDLGMDRLKLSYETAKTKLERAAGKGGSSSWMKRLNEYWDLAEAARNGDSKAAYMAQATYQDLSRSLAAKSPLERAQALALMKSMGTLHQIATAQHATQQQKAQAEQDYQKASEQLTNILEPIIQPLPLTPLMQGAPLTHPPGTTPDTGAQNMLPSPIPLSPFASTNTMLSVTGDNAPPMTVPQTPPVPVGTVQNGKRYVGGPTNDPSSWVDYP